MRGIFTSIDVNTYRKAQRISKYLRNNRLGGMIETFYDFDGAFYTIYYYTRRAKA